MGKTMEGENASYVILLEPDGETAVGTVAAPLEVALPDWHYLGGQTVTLDGTNAMNVPNISPDATILEVRARGGEVYVELNGVTASVNSPCYIPEDQAELFGSLCNLDVARVYLFSETAATVAHVAYFREC